MNKKVLAGALVAVMTLSAGLTFADTSNASSTDTKSGMRPQVRMEQRADRREAVEENMQEIIDEYYPEISDTWNDLKDQLDAVHDQIKELRTPADGLSALPDLDNMTNEEIEAFKADLFNKIKAAYDAHQSGDDADRPFGLHDAFRPARDGNGQQNLTDEERDALQEERKADMEERRAEHEAFKTAVDNGDTETIVNFIDNQIENMKARLSDAQDRLEELENAE